ncbi:MAG: hypothetical protein IJR28_02530 [Ottowia sp.]|nr:hypothetical protein [Ottowia sp.]
MKKLLRFLRSAALAAIVLFALLYCAAALFLATEMPVQRAFVMPWHILRSLTTSWLEQFEPPAKPGPFTKYSEMHSGYRDADGARMEAFLRCWKEQTLRWAQENDMQEEAAALAGRYKTQDALDALPPSAQTFWRAAAKVDWLSQYDVLAKKFAEPEPEPCKETPFFPRPKPQNEAALRRFLEPSKIKPFKEHDPEHLAILRQHPPRHALDWEYYRYNRHQEWSLRLSDFEDLRVYGDDNDSALYGEIHNEQSLDGEYQFLYYHLEGFEFRVKSFAHLLADFYMEEYQEATGRLRGDGHIYEFRDNWNKTCVPLLFDADEIASWRG